MPLPPSTLPKWKVNERRAQRNGTLGQITFPNGDTYKGEWRDDQMHGKGCYTSREHGFVYEGDFMDGRQEGYGVYSIFMSNGKLRKQYLGNWEAGLQHGQGSFFFNDEGTEKYEGEWREGNREGWGRMYYEDGSIYEGEWLDDMRHGLGLLLLKDGNRYEGQWAEDLKEGEGSYFYVTKRRCFKGTWHKGNTKCGEYFELDSAAGQRFPIPELKLANPNAVLDAASRP
ncbi:uncharacterized protein MONBRDRAFT_25019 [Monosiga brevicollis MX1]|uniref:MORN repeat-containing protein 3 n=1 Tax=Monosiga brevicollis TaxID=81824 RepID=A9UXJ1_MONBE|nr:uncharacterized protein MONBRDRAFT_25019 [Monosiga brevicollis MX1]EDQ89851.1 predicted protein [Monosiga brevicollis MX1]|eukprot:XP_001745273.1 hypothetical protein [Monosiga brevicollis MX1]